MRECRTAKLKPLRPGRAEAPVVRAGVISLLGDIDPERGVLRSSGISIVGKILVFQRHRGSTVGPYILYGLKYYGKKPAAIVMVKSEPIVVAGAPMAEIPMFEGLPQDLYEWIETGMWARVEPDGSFTVCRNW